MPQDIQRSIVPMAPSIEKSPDSPKMRPFSVPFEIKGTKTIFAEDLEGAKNLALASDKHEYAFYGELETFPPRSISPIVRLTHFQRGQVNVQAETIDGRREWTCPNRPMMRAWEDCHFRESLDEIEALLAQAHHHQFPSTKEGFGSAVISVPYPLR